MSSKSDIAGSNNVHTKLDLSDSASYLPSNLFQPKSTFFSKKQSIVCVQQLLLRRNQLDSLQIYARALSQFRQHLTELSLRENNFSQFPAEILVLKNLTSLSLANNRLEVIDKDVLPQLPNLQWLNLANNQLSDLPVDLVCCHHLRGLDVENNNFTVFPTVVFYLTRLEVLMFQKNKVKSLEPNYHFPDNLHTLNLAFNAFTQVPSTLIHQPPSALTHLHLSGNKLGQLPIKFMSVGYAKLVSLDLHTCQLTRVTGKLMEYLSNCKNLRRLNLAINRLTDIPAEIGLLSQLQWFNLNDNRITHLPDTIASLIHLIKLGLVQNHLSVLPPFMFLHMLELQKLDIRRNRLKYLPPSIMALAPRQEVDVHVDLAVPHAVFPTLSNPPCHSNSKSHAEDCHPYGGSLRTLLFYENPTIEYADGILCELEDDLAGDYESEEDTESVQALSLSAAYTLMQSSSTTDNASQVLRNGLFNKRSVLFCSNPKFRRSDHPVPNLLSEIDDDDDDEDEDEGEEENNTTGSNRNSDSEEKALVRNEMKRLMSSVPSLREICFRSHLSLSQQYLKINARLDQQHTDQTCEFLESALPTSFVPSFIQQYAQAQARQCDHCQMWYTQSPCQIGYLARLCNSRLQIPIRFDLCSTACTLDATAKLHQATVDWHTRQSLAHIDATLLLPSVGQAALTPVNTVSSIETRDRASPIHRWSTNNNNNNNATSDSARYTRHVSIATSSSFNNFEDNATTHSNPGPSLSRSTTSSRTTDSDTTSDNSSFQQPSLAASIRNRVSQFASNFFSHNYHNQQQQSSIRINDTTGISSDSNDAHSSPRQSQMMPLVLPNLNLGENNPVMLSAREFIEEEPPSIISITSRLVEGRLQTERTQPQLRLSAPTPSPIAFNHLPRDAIRLERF